MLGTSGIRDEYRAIDQWVEGEGVSALMARRQEAEALFRKVGITFAVYGEGGSQERLIPFDMIPRVFSASEWDVIERGCIQRTRALNCFLADVYGAQDFIRAGKIPKELVLNNPAFEPAMVGVRPPADVWSHICGVDVVRTGAKDFFVLEDNCRTPSGVSYMIEAREVMMQMFPQLFRENAVRPVESYPDVLADAMMDVAPPKCDGPPTLAILTPGPFNSAYYEHSFLSDRMGIELVEGQDLFCEDGFVWMRTIRGPEKVHVIYRRIDDAFLDPDTFNPDSLLGVRGLMDVYRNGGVTIFNAPGAGIGDDKAVYIYVPEMIRFFLGEEPILENVPTYQCSLPSECQYVLDNIDKLVVKEVAGSGGYGMLVGPKSTRQDCLNFAEKVKAKPSAYIAQPTLELSTAPILTDQGAAPRHVDLRPFVITGKETKLVPGGLTRVAMREGSLVVNSSQGGGIKDTWVLQSTSKAASGNDEEQSC